MSGLSIFHTQINLKSLCENRRLEFRPTSVSKNIWQSSQHDEFFITRNDRGSKCLQDQHSVKVSASRCYTDPEQQRLKATVLVSRKSLSLCAACIQTTVDTELHPI